MDNECIETNTYGLTKYKCHKEVWAGKINSVHTGENGSSLFVDFGDSGDEVEIPVSPEFEARHNPVQGEYLMLYEDGYMSVSPQDAFEGGYLPVDFNTSVKEESQTTACDPRV